MTEITVHLISIRNPKFREAVAENEDGSFSIFINANLAANQIEKAYRHALWHIEQGDFQKNDVQEIEERAHRCGQKNATESTDTSSDTPTR